MRNDRIHHEEWSFDPGNSGLLNHKRRYTSVGYNDTGFSSYKREDSLLDSNMEGSTLRYAPQHLIFMNSASTVTRTKMMVRISEDDGMTWAYSRFIYLNTAPDHFSSFSAITDAKKGGYSSMAKTQDYHIGALIETGEASTENRSIEYHPFNLDWIRFGAR